MSIKKLVFVTGNENKLREVKEIVGNYFPFRISSMKIDLPEYQGHADDISKKKCLAAAEIVHGPVMIEDTCLCFNAYKGLPGPYIKWFLDAIGCEGLFKMLTSYEDKSATAVCTFAVCLDPESKDVLLFKGVVPGNIVFPRGNNCFGWDPIFEPKGFTKTFGEIDKSEKNTISHRYKALEALRNHFTNDEADSVADASS